MADQTPTPDPDTIPTLGYHGPPPMSLVRELRFDRAGDVLTITVPAPWFSGQIIWRSFVLAICLLPASALILFCAIEVRRTDPGVFCVMVPIAILLSGSVHAVRRLIYTAHEGRMAAIVKVWPGGIEVRANGKLRAVEYSLPRRQIKHVQVHPGGGFFGGFNPTLLLEVISDDDTLYLASIPWQSDRPMIEVEDNIRDVLGIAPADS